jgi:uncharacterized Fe-S cluster protein YjdI
MDLAISRQFTIFISMDNMDEHDRQYTNGEITVFWKPGKCIHATTCYRELLEVFNPRKRPWVNMDGAPTEEIIRVVNMCPTQALSFAYNKEIGKGDKSEGVIVQEREKLPEIRVIEDGPLVLHGKFHIIDAGGNELKPMKIQSLCRCGASHTMPYCDGTHRKTGFRGK